MPDKAKVVADKGAEYAKEAIKVGKEVAKAGAVGLRVGIEEAKKAYKENK